MRAGLQINRFIPFLGIALVGLGTPAWSQTAINSPAKSDSTCSVRVRLLEATTGGQPEAKAANLVEPKIDEERPQLAVLPFERYSVIAEATQGIKSGLKSQLSLFVRGHGTHHFTIEPSLIVPENKVDLVLNWSGPEGEEVLSTQVQVENGNHVILGSGDDEDEISEAKEGTVVCVKVRCE